MRPTVTPTSVIGLVPGSVSCVTATETERSSETIATVVDFLDALGRGDRDTALGLVTDDLTYINVGMPTIRGRRGLDKAFGALWAKRVGFGYEMNHIAADGAVVLTDRIDWIQFGRFRAQFWVYGRWVIRDGQIAVWRDSFDYADIAVGIVRGLAGILVPAINRQRPA